MTRAGGENSGKSCKGFRKKKERKRRKAGRKRKKIRKTKNTINIKICLKNPFKKKFHLIF